MRFVQELRAAHACRAKFPKRRPAVVRVAGIYLHPESITDAWYAAGCPPPNVPLDVPRRDALRWRVACCLRGVDRRGEA